MNKNKEIKMNREYEPYGPEWTREVGRLNKTQLICMLASTAKERDSFKLRLDTLSAIIAEGK